MRKYKIHDTVLLYEVDRKAILLSKIVSYEPEGYLVDDIRLFKDTNSEFSLDKGMPLKEADIIGLYDIEKEKTQKNYTPESVYPEVFI